MTDEIAFSIHIRVRRIILSAQEELNLSRYSAPCRQQELLEGSRVFLIKTRLFFFYMTNKRLIRLIAQDQLLRNPEYDRIIPLIKNNKTFIASLLIVLFCEQE